MKKILFRGIECFITDVRIKDSEKIKGFNYYGIRHSDEDWSEPVTIERAVIVNNWGTLATKVDLSTHKDSRIYYADKWEIEISEEEQDMFYGDYNEKINEYKSIT